jgi:hypothetical protein
MYNKNDSIDHANANSQMQKFYRMLGILKPLKLRASLFQVCNDIVWCVVEGDLFVIAANLDGHAIGWLVGLGLSSADRGEVSNSNGIVRVVGSNWLRLGCGNGGPAPLKGINFYGYLLERLMKMDYKEATYHGPTCCWFREPSTRSPVRG